MQPRVLEKDEIEALGREAARMGDEPVWQLANELLQVRGRFRGGEITAESIVSARDGRGRVRVTWQDEEAFLDVDIATGLGQSIIEAACAARIDALFIATLSKEIGLDAESIAPLLRAVRGARRVDDDRPQ